MHRVSAAPDHQLLLPREEALLQTRLPTVRTRPPFLPVGSDDARVRGALVAAWRALGVRKKDSKVLFELHQIDSAERAEVHN